MNYTLNQLQIFVKVAQTLSITKAAEELNLTQPAVSIQIKNFQAQFEIPLIEIIGKKIYITDFGKEIATSAEEILDQVYAINYKTSAFKGQLFGKIRVSVVSTGKYVLPYFLSDFLRINPGIEVSIDVTNREKVIESLENNLVDFSLISTNIESSNYEYINILKNEIHMIGNAETAAMNPTFQYNDLKNELPLIFRENGSATRKIMEDYFKNQNMTILKKIELMSNEAIKQAVLAGMGYSIMPLIGIKNEIANGKMVIIPMKGLPHKNDWKLIWHKEKKQSPATHAFMAYLNENKELIRDKYFK
jgi:DNA-binding transcriptional LysR family regulator